jgi:hypothetical protein
MTDVAISRNELDHDRSINLETYENTKILEHIQRTNGIVKTIKKFFIAKKNLNLNFIYFIYKSASTSIVQLFFGSKEDGATWSKFSSGVLCLVRDCLKKSYFFRLFSLTVKMD